MRGALSSGMHSHGLHLSGRYLSSCGGIHAASAGSLKAVGQFMVPVTPWLHTFRAVGATEVVNRSVKVLTQQNTLSAMW
jgi:hypothetical protein